MSRLDFERYNVTTYELTLLIESWIYNRRDREVLKAKLIEGLTYEQAAERFDISRGTAVNIVNKGLSIIERHLN